MGREIILYEFTVTILGENTIPDRDVARMIQIVKDLPIVEMLTDLLAPYYGRRIRIEVGGK